MFPLISLPHFIDYSISSKKSLLHPIWLKCRQIGPMVSPFLNIFQVFYTGSGAVEPVEKEDYNEEYVILDHFFSSYFHYLV